MSPPLRLFRRVLRTPLGEMTAVASARGLTGLAFQTPKRLGRLERRLERRAPGFTFEDGWCDPIEAAALALERYFAGTEPGFGAIPLDPVGSAFERRTWDALTAIAPGRLTTYGALARRQGRPGATRAVGRAVGANPIGIVVPCHRVVGADGSLTGYGGGLERKAWLLAHEARWWASESGAGLPFELARDAGPARAPSIR